MVTIFTKKCGVDACLFDVHARGYCNKHYMRYQRHGVPTAGRRSPQTHCEIGGCPKLHKSNGYCANHYARLRRTGKPDLRHGSIDSTPTLRFWSRVALTADSSRCWEWQKGRDSFGYGSLHFQGKHRKAHQVAWLLYYGKLPSEPLLRHKCDNPPCCNPAHLIPGTQQDNNRDKMARNRQAKGERSGGAKLTEGDVLAIRQMVASDVTHRVIASKFSIAPHTVWTISNRQTWRHI